MVSVANETSEIVLSTQDLREVTRYAAENAQEVLEIFERAHPADSRPRDAVDAAWTFARGGERGKALRDTAWAALSRQPRPQTQRPAGEAARAAMCAASAAYLHPLADAHQVKHILGAAAHAARAAELMAGGDPEVGASRIERAGPRDTRRHRRARRYPAAPPGGGRIGVLLRDLDQALRNRL